MRSIYIYIYIYDISSLRVKLQIMTIAGNTRRRHSTETCQHELDKSGFLYSGSDIKSSSMKYIARRLSGVWHTNTYAYAYAL